MPFKMAGVVGSLLSPWQQLRDRVRWAMKNQSWGEDLVGIPLPSPLFSQCPIASLQPQGDGGGLFEHVQIFVLQLIWREPAYTGSGSWVAANLCFFILNTVLQIRILRNWRQHWNDGILAISVVFLLFLLRVLIMNHSVVHVYVHTHTYTCLFSYV